MMDYKNISGNQKRWERQDDRMDRMRGLLGGHMVRKRNPVNPVYPVKKVLSDEAVARLGLDGDRTNYGRPALRAISAHRGSSVRNSLICRIGLTQLVDFHDISTYFHMVLVHPFAVLLEFLKVQNWLTQVVDFHDNFR
jgi:hypothetical protein